MSTTAASARLAQFFYDLSDQFQFMDCNEINVHTRGSQGETPLKIAVVRDDVQIVTDLLEAGANPNLQGEDDYTPLHHAASHGHLEIISLLLAHGASNSLVNMDGRAPSDIARSMGHKAAYALLATEKPRS